MTSNSNKTDKTSKTNMTSQPQTTRRALITGAGGEGIGRAAAIALAQAGTAVAIHAHRSIQRAQTLADELTGAGHQAAVVTGNMRDVNDIASIATQAKAALGGVDIVVHCAGAWIREPLSSLNLAVLDELYETDVRGPVALSQHFAESMRAQGFGRIIHISSVAADRYIEGEGGYGAAKSAINAITRAWACELGPFGVTANAIAPAWTLPNHDAFPPSPADYPQCADVPNRRPGHARDVAALIAFLASDAAAHLNGQIIHLDGGVSALSANPGS